MTKPDPFDDPDQLRLPAEWLPKYAEPSKPVPEKIRKRRQLFVQMPMWWVERLRDSEARLAGEAAAMWTRAFTHRSKNFGQYY